MILHIVFTRSLAGAERSALNSVRSLYSSGLQAKIAFIVDLRFATRQDVVRLAQESRKAGVAYEVYETDRRWDRSVLHKLIAAMRFATVVHSHGYKSDLYISIARCYYALFVSRKVTPQKIYVSTQHGYPNGSIRSSINETIGDIIKITFDQTILVSSEIKARWLFQFRRRCRVIESTCPSLELDQYNRASAKAQFVRHYKIATHGKSIGWLGRFQEVKGPDIFAKGLARIDEPVTVLIGGRGPWLELLGQARLSPNLRVYCLGEVADIRGFFASLDILVMSSRQEGSPMVLLEAIQAGIPFVAPRVGGIPRLCGASQQEFLFTVGDDREMAEKISNLLRLSAVAVSSITEENAGIFRERFSTERHCQALSEVYGV